MNGLSQETLCLATGIQAPDYLCDDPRLLDRTFCQIPAQTHTLQVFNITHTSGTACLLACEDILVEHPLQVVEQSGHSMHPDYSLALLVCRLTGRAAFWQKLPP